MQELLEAVWLEAAYQIFIFQRGPMPTREFWFHACQRELGPRRISRVYN
jgi:hypothetical protein